MPTGRMNREQFFGQLAALDEQRLKKALWNLYWRGSAAMRERIEAENNPDQYAGGKRPSKELVDTHSLLGKVADFAALARSGAYMADVRRVSPRERTRWRLRFKRLVSDAEDGLRGQDATAAATALEQLIDLACEARDYEYFHSEDPMEAAGFVVSDAVALLWTTLQAQHGFAGFAQRAAPQLLRWESRYGWTRSGYGRVGERRPRWLACWHGCYRLRICRSGLPTATWTPLTGSPAMTRPDPAAPGHPWTAAVTVAPRI